jgi:phage gp46-like protein
MTDIRIVSKADLWTTVSDWLLLPTGLLDESEELANYAKVALMTDRLSDIQEIRPDPDSDDRRGWWGDYQAELWRGWPIGTKNWLLTRAKINDTPSFEGDTVVRAETYTREALQPLVDIRMCSAINVRAARVGTERIDVGVVLYRGNLPEVALLFQDLWAAMREEPTLSVFGVTP